MDPLARSAVTGGFADPVFGSQSVFRALMNAFAEPGTTTDLGGHVEPPRALAPGVAAILAALSDPDAPAFLETPDEEAGAWLAFQTGAAPVADPGAAAFVALRARSDPAGWSRYALGDQAYPDRAATLLLPVDSLDGGESLALAGPGIETRRLVSPSGLPEGFLDARASNAALFPRGHDLVLVAGSRILALPRTTRIERA